MYRAPSHYVPMSFWWILSLSTITMEIHVLGLSAFIAQVNAINKKKELCHLLFREDLNDGWCFWSFVFGICLHWNLGKWSKNWLAHRYVQIGESSINQLLFPSSWVLSVHRINTCRHFSPESYLVTMLTWNVHKPIKWPTFNLLGYYIISSLGWMKFKLLHVMVGNGWVTYHTNTTKTCIFQNFPPGLVASFGWISAAKFQVRTMNFTSTLSMNCYQSVV